MALQRTAAIRHVSPQKSTAEASQPSDCRQPAVAMAMAAAMANAPDRVLSGALDSFPREALEKEEEMFDLNEPADEPLAPEASAAAAATAAAAEKQDREEKDLSPRRELGDEQEEEEEEEEEGACSGLSLLAHSVEQWKPKKRALGEEAQEQGAPTEIQASHQEEIQLEKPGSECRGLLPVSPSEENDDDLNAKEWRLSSAPAAPTAAKEQQRSASWPRSQRPAALVRSTSFQMFCDERADNNVVDSNGRAEVGQEEEPKNNAPGNLCEFFPIDENGDHRPGDNATTTTTTTNLEVSHDKLCSSIDLIDAREEKTSITTLEESSPAPPPDHTTTIAKNNSSSGETMIQHDHSDPLDDDSKFVSVIWQGQINFQDVTVPSMVAACSTGWQHVFKNRKVADDLTVQRFASTDKFLGAVKEYVAEPGVKVTQKSSASSQNLNKLVEFLVGGGTGNDGPLVAVVPLHDQDKAWLADLYLVPASALSEAEPGELSSCDEDFLYGFVSLSPPGDGDDESSPSFAWLKDGASTIVDEPVTTTTSKKQPASNGDVLVEDKRAPPPEPAAQDVDLSGDSKHQQQDLEEGQLVSEEQGGKEAVAYTSYERRKRYGEDEKKSKANGGEADGKTRERHRHRDHERDKEQDRERAPRRDRDREVDHRDRDNRDNRESVYARRSGNYEYLPRLDTSKSGRHRDGDKERGPHTWENGGRGRERVRSRSKEREKERERLPPPPPPPLPPAEKNAKDARGKKVTVVEPSKKHEAFDKKKRERSPDYKGSNGKRLKESEVDKHDDGRGGRKKDVDGDYPVAKMQGKDKAEVTRHHHQGSEERGPAASPDRKDKDYTIVTGEDENEAYAEMFVRSCDPDIRSWVPSMQNARQLREDYGVTLLMDVMESQQEALHLKLSSRYTETCPPAEARYFVRRAAEALGDVVLRGVFSKILWYPGQLDPLSVASVIRKLQGDGEEISSLDRIQESTGIMVGVVLDGDAKKSAKVGLRLSTARKSGLVQATKQTLELLDQVAMEISKESSIPPPGENRDAKLSRRPLYVTNCPDYASPRMLKGIFENVLRERVKKSTELPPGFESTDMVSDVKYASEDSNSFFVEFSSDELLEATLQIYTADRDLFCGLKVELPSPAAMKVYDMLLVDDQRGKAAAAAVADRDEFGSDLLVDVGRRKVKPLYLTELGKYTSSEQVKRLFEEVISSHINQSLDGKLVTAIRHVPSRGCMFVDLATPELVEYMLDLHNRHPEEFGHMKMELGRSNDGVEKKRSFASLDRSRSERNMSPTPRVAKRRNLDDGGEDGGGDDGYGGGGGGRRKQRSDPEKTVYADHLPENSSDAVIRKIFRAVLLEHMTGEQRAALGDEVVTEVRHVRAKYCAFVVFVSEDLARLALELYSRDEEIFDHMRLKPHFNSKLEDMYREDGHDRDDEATPHSSISGGLGLIGNSNSSSSSALGVISSSSNISSSALGLITPTTAAAAAAPPAAASNSGTPELDFQDSRGRSRGGGGGNGGNGVFKEVDRKRSVYVDRIPDKYPETAIKEVLDRYLRRKGRGSPSYVVSHVSFFRDKYDSTKLCAFVEVRNEDAVQDLLDCYAADEGAFEGMRIRPAVKYSH